MWGGMTARPREENTITPRTVPAGTAPRRLSPAPLRAVQHRGQLRMAERFLAEHGTRLRYVHGIGWHSWDGVRWLEDEERIDLDSAVETIKSALREAMEMPPDERDELLKDVRKAESASGLEGIVKIASARYPVSTPSRALDADVVLFNTPGGTIHLDNETLQPHDRGDHITKVAGGSITDGHNEEWEAFLVRILPDEEVRRFVQRLVGLAMLGAVREHVMPIFTGTGANGKGTFRDAIAAAFGDYAYEADPQLLMESKHERHGTFKMQLRGRRIVFCSETERDRRFAEATMKRLVGGDPIEANRMHRDPIKFDPSHTLIMLTNHLPKVSGDDPAVWRRILVVPFDVVIPVEERDPDLPRRLKEATDAVLSWAFDGWLEYREKGLAPPEAVQRRTSEYQARSDVMARFFEDRVLENPHGRVKARDLYAAWTSWCHSTGEMPTSEVAFSAAMEARGFEKKRGAAGQQYLGLLLQSEDDDDDPDSGFRASRDAAVAQLLTPRQPLQGQISGT
jgi:putative DNA primase/helicase